MRVKTRDKTLLDLDNLVTRQFNQSVYSFQSYNTSYQWKTPQEHDGQLVPKQEVPSGGGAELPLCRAQPHQE